LQSYTGVHILPTQHEVCTEENNLSGKTESNTVKINKMAVVKVAKPEIVMMKCVGGRQRSALLNLTKAQIVEAIIEKMPAVGWPRIEAFLGIAKLRKATAEHEFKLRRKTVNWMTRSMEYADQRRRELLRFPHARLVQLTYWMSDLELNRRYNSGQKTLADSQCILEDEREIELDTKSLRRMLRKGRTITEKVAKEKPVKKVREHEVFAEQVKAIVKNVSKDKGRKLSASEKRRISRKASKVRTMSWITTLRKHLTYMGRNCETVKAD
jgi:hypothetical protein